MQFSIFATVVTDFFLCASFAIKLTFILIAVPGCGAVVNDGAYHSGSHLAGANIANNVQNTKNR